MDDDLVRDKITNALLNKDNTKYIERKKQKLIAKKAEQRIKNLERDVSFLKNTIAQFLNRLN